MQSTPRRSALVVAVLVAVSVASPAPAAECHGGGRLIEAILQGWSVLLDAVELEAGSCERIGGIVDPFGDAGGSGAGWNEKAGGLIDPYGRDAPSGETSTTAGGDAAETTAVRTGEFSDPL